MRRGVRRTRRTAFVATLDDQHTATSETREHAEQLAREADECTRYVRGLRDHIRRQRDALPRRDGFRKVLTAVLRLNDRKFCDVHLATLYPNPERVGCPSHETLVGLALRDDQTEPEWDHILECFPCIREVRGINEAQTAQPSWQ